VGIRTAPTNAHARHLDDGNNSNKEMGWEAEGIKMAIATVVEEGMENVSIRA